ncbi:MAG: ABC transporter permease [Bosea sp.]|nr:ABC transporter permease [Bosea sp. (in: a-proteobacteria)]
MAALVFVGVYAIGNPIDILISPDATENDRLQTIARLGLDRPLWEQFFSYFGNLLRGDFGNSFVFGDSAMSVILQRLPATMELALLALLLAIVIGVPLGVLAGLYPDSIGGRSIMAGSILGFSLPNFWQGLMLILIFGVYLGWLPSGGRGPTTELFGIRVSFLSLEGLKYMVLPSINLALFKMALVIRLARAGTREVMMQDYIKFARAKGLSRSRLVTVHVLKNIMIPIVTVLGLELGSMIAFAVITETVFSWPGMGKLLIDSINRLDRPVIVAYLMLIVVIFVIINFLVDLLYSALDPRVRLMQRGAQ